MKVLLRQHRGGATEETSFVALTHGPAVSALSSAASGPSRETRPQLIREPSGLAEEWSPSV